MSTEIKGYRLTRELSNENAGMCQWGFAEKDGFEFFIKQFLKPKYPADDCGLSPKMIQRLRASDAVALPAELDYASISGLSKEIQHKLAQARPETLGQASRIPGVTPAAVSLLLIHLKKRSAGRSLEHSA